MLKVDVYNHIFPKPFFDRLQQVMTDPSRVRRWLEIPFLHDLDTRFRKLEEFDEYAQVLSLSAPAIEFFATGEVGIDLARIGNDAMAELVERYPDRFPAFIASLPMSEPEASAAETIRAVKELGAVGIQVFSNVNGAPLDEPRFFTVFETAAELGCPVFLHPARGPNVPDYATETRSRYEIWWAFGWPYETSAAMARMVFSRMFDRLANLRVVAHHLGAMVPFFEGRVGIGWDELGIRTVDEDYSQLMSELKRRPLDYFKECFWADTAVFGSDIATRCGLDFYGPDRVMFASDAPFDPEGGSMFIRETIRVIDNLDISDEARVKIYRTNAEQLLGRRFG